MKTITLYLTSKANTDPNRKGYTIHVIDPDPGIPHERRTLASGFAVPIPVQVPDNAEIAESTHGEPFLWIGDCPLALRWHRNRGLVSGWPAMHPAPERFTDRWVFQSVKAFAVPVW